ncbi:sensor domain-containing diguanylate cyclase [bacterium]|nr:sensor domain-containing diguanylate cyclase [bacterium]
MAKPRGKTAVNPTAKSAARCKASVETLEREKRRLEREAARLETELFETREIIAGVKALDRVSELTEKVKIFNTIVRERTGSPISIFYLYWPDRDAFELVECTGNCVGADADRKVRLTDCQGRCANSRVGHTFARTDGLFWELVCQGEIFPVHAPGGRHRFEDVFTNAGLLGWDITSIVPLTFGGTPIGFAAFRPDLSSVHENEAYVRRFATQAASSIKTAMLYSANQDDKAALNRTLKNLKMLYNIGQMMAHITELKELLRFILDEACKTTDAEKGSLMLLDEEHQRLVVRVVRGLPDKDAEDRINNGETECTSLSIGEGVAGTAFMECKPMIVNDVQNDPKFKTQSKHVKSILCVPLIANDEAIGVINITNKNDGAGFSGEDAQLISALANQAAISIHRSRLYNLAIMDELTGLYVRRYFAHRLQEEIKRADRFGTKFSVIMFDIDHFKSVNDTFGHHAGDQALVTVANTLKAAARTTDLPARFGGEEFVILLPETNGKGATMVAERIRKTVEQTHVSDIGRSLTISAGVSVYPDHGSEMLGLVKSADMALYEAKHGGRNRVVLWELLGAPADEEEHESAAVASLTPRKRLAAI